MRKWHKRGKMPSLSSDTPRRKRALKINRAVCRPLSNPPPPDTLEKCNYPFGWTASALGRPRSVQRMQNTRWQTRTLASAPFGPSKGPCCQLVIPHCNLSLHRATFPSVSRNVSVTPATFQDSTTKSEQLCVPF